MSNKANYQEACNCVLELIKNAKNAANASEALVYAEAANKLADAVAQYGYTLDNLSEMAEDTTDETEDAAYVAEAHAE